MATESVTATRAATDGSDLVGAICQRLGTTGGAMLIDLLALNQGSDPRRTAESVFKNKRADRLPSHRSALYAKLRVGGDGDVPVNDGVAKTEIGMRLLKLAESGDPEEAAQMLALWTAMRFAQGAAS